MRVNGVEEPSIVRVSGGPRSVMADLDDLEHTCVGLEQLEPSLSALRMPLRQWAEELPAHAGAAPVVHSAAERLRQLEVEAVQVQEIARTTATSVRISVDRYRAAERGARHAVERAEHTLAEARDHLVEAGRDGLTVDEAEQIVRNAVNSGARTAIAALIARGLFTGIAKKAPMPDSVRGMVDVETGKRRARAAGPSGEDARSPWAKARTKGASMLAKGQFSDPAAALAAWVMAGPAGDAVDEVANVENTMAAAGLALPSQPVELMGEPREVAAPPEALDGGVGSVMDLQDAVVAAGPGHLGITEVETASGETAYILTLPGTQTEALENPPPAGDLAPAYWRYEGFAGEAGIVDALGRRSEKTGEGVAAALAAAGVPAGATVVTAGHSQGGLHAVNLLSHGSLATRYRMAGAYTYGAPSANLPTPRGTPVLQVEDGHDVVVASDGGPNPATADRVTVTLASAAPLTGDELAELLADPSVGEALSPTRREERLERTRELGQRILEPHRYSAYREQVGAVEAAGLAGWGAAAPTVQRLGRLTRGRVVRQQTVPLGRVTRVPQPEGADGPRSLLGGRGRPRRPEGGGGP